MGVFQNNLMGAAAAAASAGGDFYSHQIANSCRFNQSDTAHMYHTQGTPTNADKCTISAWVKRGKMGNADSMFTGSGIYGYDYSWYGFNTANEFYAFQDNNGTVGPRLESNGLFRDPSSWYHVVIAQDSTQGTAANRNKIYINGVQYTDWGDYETYSPSNADFMINSSGRKIFVGSGGASEGNSWLPFDGYIAEYVFIDGTQYAATDFGESKNGVWIPKDPSGLTFGNNGCYLKFESSSDLGNDSSGNNNDFTLSNVSAHDQMLDSPTFNSDSNGGNFPTYNFLTKGSYTDLSEGNCRADSNTGADASYPSGNFAMTSGKWYYEQLIGNLTNSYPSVGLVACNNVGYDLTRGTFYAMRLRSDTGVAQQNSGDNIAPFGTITVNTTGVASVGTGDIVSWYVDMDNKKAWFAKNGTIANSGDPANGTNPQFSWTENPPGGITFMSQEYQTSYTVVNAGQDGTFAGNKTAQGNSDDTGYGNFYYDPPTGFLALCSGNLPVADTVDPAQTNDNYPQKLFGAKTYTGNGGTNNITGLGFQPDFTWIKIRNTASNGPLVDSSRGTNKILFSQITDTEVTSANLTSFDSDGFSLAGGLASYDANFNGNSNTYASWSWRANGGTTSTNTQGDTNSTVQVDPSGHFSIVLGTGDNDNWGNPQTFGHGLSAAPTCIIGKKRTDNADEWQVFFSDYGNATIGGSNAASNSLVLNSSAALYTNQSYKGWGGVMPTSTVFTLDGNNLVQNGDTFVCYCFANCEGYIKSGTYEGNGNADGTFVYTGFRPAWIMCKRIDSSSFGNWRIMDNVRDPDNVGDKSLLPNNHGAEESGSSNYVDLLSNGFKLRNTQNWNSSSSTYVFLAMAKNPLKYTTAR